MPLLAFTSAALHVGLIALVTFFGKSTRSEVTDRPLIDVTVEPALGLANGNAQGKGLGMHTEVPDPISRGSHRAAAVHSEPDGLAALPSKQASIPPASSLPELPQANASQPAAIPSGQATPIGSADVLPGLGTPGGSETGVGMTPPKPKMTPQYASLLAGWFGSRFNVRGLGMAPEELRELRVRVSITISEDRRIQAFSLSSSSGNGAYDQEVRQTISGIQSGGISLPAPADGSTPPSTFSLIFRPVDVH